MHFYFQKRMDKEAISQRYHRERTESIFKRIFIAEEKKYREYLKKYLVDKSRKYRAIDCLPYLMMGIHCLSYARSPKDEEFCGERFDEAALCITSEVSPETVKKFENCALKYPNSIDEKCDAEFKELKKTMEEEAENLLSFPEPFVTLTTKRDCTEQLREYMEAFREHGDYDQLTKNAWVQLASCAVPPLFWNEYRVLEKCARETSPEDPAFTTKCSKEIESLMKVVIEGLKQPLVDYLPAYSAIMKFWIEPPPDPFKKRDEYLKHLEALRLDENE